MDIAFKAGNEKFNYRVCAIILNDGKILAMHDERSPYFYLPGGRVKLGETAEDAVIRELKEELNIIKINSETLNNELNNYDKDILELEEKENVINKYVIFYIFQFLC